MRLANIGAGELADRLTILALKIAHAEQAGKDAQHFTNERNVLLTQVRAMNLSLEHLFDLAATNAMLWYSEDALREWRRVEEAKGIDAMDAPKVITCAFRIQAQNDKRAELVGALNKQAGTDLGPEKVTHD